MTIPAFMVACLIVVQDAWETLGNLNAAATELAKAPAPAKAWSVRP